MSVFEGAARVTAIVGAVISIASHAAHADDFAAADSDFRLTLDGAWMYGPVRGNVQTPAGGMPGSTSDNRPTLEELGIDHLSVFDSSAALGWDEHEILVGGQWIGLSERATLGQPLMSQGQQFPAGSLVDADVQFDWYRLGYRHRFELGDRASDGPRFILWPGAGAAMLDFSYQLDSPGVTGVDRSYHKVAPQLGLELEWKATERFSIVGEVSSTLPFSNMPFILTTELKGKYTFLDSRGISISCFAGIGYETISYEDNQQMPNEVELDLGPMLMLGLEVRF